MKAPYIVALALAAGLHGSLCLCQEAKHEEVNHAKVAAVVLKACVCVQENCTKCPCSKPKPQQEAERSEGVEAGDAVAQEETQAEEAERCPCSKPRPPRSQAISEDAQEETASEEAERCPCSKPRPNRSVKSESLEAGDAVEAQEETQVEEAERCPCSKPRPSRSEAVEQEETQVEEAERCGCNKPKPNRSVKSEVVEETHVEAAAPAAE
jgi:hypothetical protein